MTKTNEMLVLEQDFLELKIKVAKLEQICDNLRDEITMLKDTGSGTGIYLDGVPETYRKEIQKELDSGKR